ncbi:hypothetical protein [Alkalihalobacillus trypoxylicola]|nr:hypothetical protein [Alkalihalobacillus trypoxylicola]
MHQRLEDHEGRLIALESQRREQEKMNSEIRQKLTDTENTVLKESGRQIDLSQQLLNHVLGNDVNDRKFARERQKFTQQQIWKIVGVVAGSGGLIYLLLENFLTR